MHIMPAGMHDRLLDAVDVDLRHRRGIGQAAVLFQRQAIHIRAHQHRRAIAILHHGNHARTANAFRDFVAQAAKLRSEAFGGFRLTEREFRVLVEIEEQRPEIFLVILRDGSAEVAVCRGNSGRAKCDQRGGKRPCLPVHAEVSRCLAQARRRAACCKSPVCRARCLSAGKLL